LRKINIFCLRIYENSINRLINDFFKIVKKIEDRLPSFKFENGIGDYETLLKYQKETKFDKFDPSYPVLEVKN